MATRIVKRIECDRLACRKRKGARKCRSTFEVADEHGEFTNAPQISEGELCPAHRETERCRQVAMYDNTKEYEDGTDSAE